ncbi:Chromatin modification-related protein MEAF6 [Zostera marina]|uniref:Chromatin modification-related protein MEAF6 n=1 Tax=Zostera marina TaxID=29655 RepID=A0A0K9Q517_ZOSMR|nr:Chromatin modification-related protein MEAF6 [Zostera marina]
MDSEGNRHIGNTAGILASIIRKRQKTAQELQRIEKQVYDMETSYLQDSTLTGNVFKGFEGFLSSSKNTAYLKRPRKFQPEDRLFSLSSVTSPATEELLARRDDGKSKGGGGTCATNSQIQNKQKKAARMLALRDGKKARQCIDMDIDDDDDPDVTLR